MKEPVHPILLTLLFALCIALPLAAQLEGDSVIIGISIATVFDANQRMMPADTVVAPNAPSRITRKIRQSTDGSLLFAAYSDIVTYDGTSFSRIAKTQGLESFDAFDVLESVEGSFWIASTHFGVYEYDGAAYTHFSTMEGLVHDRTMCLYEDHQGTIWIGTEGGISCYDGARFRNLTTADGLTNHNINTIVADQHGAVWVGTRGALCIYDPTASEQDEIHFTEYVDATGQSFTNIWSIVEDDQGQIWLSGEGGVWRITATTSTKIVDYSTTGMHLDTKGNLWFTHRTNGPHPAGLSYFSASSLLKEQPILTQVLEGNGMFFGLGEDQYGHIWVGTLSGVFRYDGTSVTYFVEE